MAFWKIHSEDIINNTGITLANPTGVAGTYALRNQPNITSYSWDTATINGELFTGKIVTVGSGKDYSTFYAAFVAQLSDPDDVLMLVDAGTYAEWPSDVAPVLTNKKLYIRGMGSSAANTQVINRNGRSNMLGFSTGCTIIIENIYIWCNGGGWRYAVGLFNNANVIVNKSYLDGLAYSPGDHCLCASSFSGYGFISNTKMNKADYHISGLLYTSTTAESVEHIYLDKVELTSDLRIRPYYPADPESDLAKYLALNDHVTTPTENYGYNYGNFLILPASPIIDRHDLSWGGGTAQQITEDGVYTLSDGSNTIEATVDYSELAIEDATDNVRIEKVSKRYWVNGPGNFYDPDHWSHESGGEGGLIGSPNDDDDIVIDENSFTARGQFINFKELV